MITNKQIGDANQQSRRAAARTLAKLRGKKISALTPTELKLLITALAQWQGLANKYGIIK